MTIRELVERSGSQSQHVSRADVATEVREWIEQGQVVGEELTAIVLMHDGHNDPVHTVPSQYIPKDPRAEKVDDLVETLCRKMEGDARAFKGEHQTYYLEARSGHRVFAHMTFGLAIEDTRGKRGGYRPNEEGIVSLTLRYLDKFAERQLTKSDGEITRADKRLEAAFAREENMRNELMALRAENDELRTAKELREQNAEAAREKAAMVRELFRDLKTYGPVILNRLAGNEVVPASELAPEQLLLRQCVRELDGPEIAGAISMLAQANPRVGVMLAELVLKVKGEDERRDRVSDAARTIIADAKKLEEPKAEATAPVKLNGSPVAKTLEAANPTATHRNGAPVSRGFL